MSSTTAAATTTTTERQTYWCHECDMSVILLTPPTTPPQQPLLCPHCQSDFLEQMDSTSTTTTTTTTNPNPNNDYDPSATTTATFTTHDDNFLLESPFFTRLIQHLADTSSDNETKTISSIETIPTIKITSLLLEKDPVLLCAICKDQFVLDVDVKQLPCQHLYHCECITPWLKNHNSCPVCRFKIPTETTTRRRGMAGVVRFAEFLEDEDSFRIGFGSTLRHIARRHGMVLSNVGEGRVNDDDVDNVNVMSDVTILSTSLPTDLRI